MAFDIGGAWKLDASWVQADHTKHAKVGKNSTSCLAAVGFNPTPPKKPTPPLPPAPPAVAGDGLVMEECTDPTNQDVGCVPTNGTCGGPRKPTATNGMNRFLHHDGLCLEGNLTDLLMHTARCNISIRNQRFATFSVPGPVAGGYLLAMNPEHENKITYCITGNCTIINATAIDCAPAARIGLAPCSQGNWPGSTLPGMYDPRQLWTNVSACVPQV